MLFAAAVAGSLLQLTSLAQSDRNFAKRRQMSAAYHQRGLDLADQQHMEAQTLDRTLHQKKLMQSKALFYVEMAHAQEIARREAVRDVWSQRNQIVQTIMVLDSLLFSCAFQLLNEGILPPSPPVDPAFPIVYSSTCATAMCVLFVSLWLAVKVESRLSNYNLHNPATIYTCSKRHPTFTGYFDCHCRRMQSVSVKLFLAGTMLTIIGVTLLVIGETVQWPPAESTGSGGSGAGSANATSNETVPPANATTASPSAASVVFGSPAITMCVLCVIAVVTPFVIKVWTAESMDSVGQGAVEGGDATWAQTTAGDDDGAADATAVATELPTHEDGHDSRRSMDWQSMDESGAAEAAPDDLEEYPMSPRTPQVTL